MTRRKTSKLVPVPFTWRRDAAGYELADSGRVIRRRGGELVKYEPDTVNPPIHREFVARPHTPEGVLDFVRAYGFLGSAYGGDDAQEENVDWLLKQHDRFRFFDMLDYDASAKAAEAARGFNEYVQPQMTVRLEARGSGLRLAVVPCSLAAWMWLRVADELVGAMHIAKCLYCGKPLMVGKGFATTRRKFCSDTHRVAWGRAQKR